MTMTIGLETADHGDAVRGRRHPNRPAGIGTSEAIGGPDARSWFEVVAREPGRLRRFYASLFDWPLDAIDPTDCEGVRPVGGEYERPSAGAAVRRPAESRRWDAFYVEVEDLATTISRACALGGRLLVPVTRLDDARIAVIADPEDHPIGLSQPV